MMFFSLSDWVKRNYYFRYIAIFIKTNNAKTTQILWEFLQQNCIFKTH